MSIKGFSQAELERSETEVPALPPILTADDSTPMSVLGTNGPEQKPRFRQYHPLDGPITDQELLGLCQARDPDAWTRLVERYERLVFMIAIRNGLNSEDAADVTQSTFAALFDSIDRLRDGERLPFWLMTVARRHAWRVTKRAEREASFSDIHQETPNAIEAWERRTVLHNAIEQLPPPCRRLLEALYFDPSAPSYADLAKQMDRAVGGIGPMRGRCLDHLKSILGEEFAS